MNGAFFRSLSFRLTVLYAGMFCFSVTLLGGAYYWVSVYQPRQALKVLAERDFAVMQAVDKREGRSALIEALRQHDTGKGRRDHFYALIDRDGRTVIANLPSWPSKPGDRWLEVEADIFVEGQEIDHYAILRDGMLSDGARLLTGWDADEVLAREEQLRAAAAWLIGGTIFLAVCGALLMTAAISKRLDAINRAALTVMGGDLSQRVPLKGTGDDFDRLATTLNIMLSRIESLFEAVKRVSDSAAHELRTPLTRLIGHLDRVDLDMVGDNPRKSSLFAAMQEADRLNRILDATLRISRVEGRRYEARIRTVDLAVLAEDVCDYYQPEAERRAITLTCAPETDASVEGDADLLFQALTNLVDNAIKFAGPGGHVTIASGIDGNGRFVSVADNGPGLAPGEAHHVTESFYRGASGHAVPGEGLGLSLVAAIADWHGCRLEFVNTSPGLVVTLRWS